MNTLQSTRRELAGVIRALRRPGEPFRAWDRGYAQGYYSAKGPYVQTTFKQLIRILWMVKE